MTSYPPGWYPDGSGRFAQRFYDGRAWTEHVLDGRGNGGTDPVGIGAPTQYASDQHPQLHDGRSSAGVDDPFVATIGQLIVATGALLLVLSLFVLDFLRGDGQGIGLAAVGDAPGDGGSPLLDGYAAAGRFLAVLPILLAGFAALRLPALGRANTTLPVLSAIACAVFALWHLGSMVATGDIDASPTFDAFLGLVGYAALAAGPYVRRPLSPSA